MSQQAQMPAAEVIQSITDRQGCWGQLRPIDQLPKDFIKNTKQGQLNTVRVGLVVHLLACLCLPSILQRLCHVDFRSIIALQQQDEGLEAAQAVALGS